MLVLSGINIILGSWNLYMYTQNNSKLNLIAGIFGIVVAVGCPLLSAIA